MTVSAVHHFIIEPKKGVGPIRFGMHKNGVSEAFTYVYQGFYKTPASRVRSDYCEVVGLIIHYDDASRVNFIEIVKARYATVTLELFGQDVTGISVRRLVDLVQSKSFRAEKHFYGYDFTDLEMSTYNDDFESEDSPIDCLSLGLAIEAERA